MPFVVPGGTYTALLTALLSFAAASLAMILLRRFSTPRGVGAGGSHEDLLSEGRVFVFAGKRLWLATEDGRRFLANAADDAKPWDALVTHFSKVGAHIPDRMDALISRGKSFVEDAVFDDGTVLEVEGRPRGNLAAVYIRDVTDAHRRRIKAEERARELEGEIAERDALLNHAPCLIWRMTEDGDVIWSNSAFSDAVRIAPPEDPEQAQEASPKTISNLVTAAFVETASSEPERTAIESFRFGRSQRDWLDVTGQAAEDGGRLGFATPINDLVKAEETLRRFIATLTETFAHLPVGLAIFDEKRVLGLFNPALTDLIGVEAAWLAARPSLREFMERLREDRIMPEYRDYEQWRANVARFEAAAAAGTLSEHWLLSSGQTLHVTGRPHPNNAVAILIEDVTASITLERRYRSEIELSRATLDRMQEGVAVFDTAGRMAFSNSAFQSLWDFSTEDTADRPTIAQVTEHCADLCEPSPVWGDLRDFGTGSEQRAEWDAELRQKTGAMIHGVFAPMPDGSTLTVFLDISDEQTIRSNLETRIGELETARQEERVAVDWAIAQLRGGLKDAAVQLRAANDEPTSTSLTQTLATTEAVLDAVRQRDALPASDTPLSGELTALVTHRGMSVEISTLPVAMPVKLSPRLRRGLMGAMAFALEVASAGITITVQIEVDNEREIAMIQMPSPGLDADLDAARATLPYRLLERGVRETDGLVMLRQHISGGPMVLTMELPLAQSGTPEAEDTESTTA